jgi:hypothetical protein
MKLEFKFEGSFWLALAYVATVAFAISFVRWVFG